jgi:hypothetical protein
MSNDVTYVPTGQIAPSGGGNGGLDIGSLATNFGGARDFSLLLANQQLVSLQKTLSIAQNYYNENVQDFNFWNTTYNPKMSTSLNEAMTRPFYTQGTFTSWYGQLDYLSNTGRGQSTASYKYDKEWFFARRRVNKYNVGQAMRLDLKVGLARYNNELEGWNLGYRYEDNRKMMYDEQRHAHQAQILNLGIGAGNAARMGLATAVHGVTDALTQRASERGAMANGLAGFGGYFEQMQGIGQQRATPKQYALATSTGKGAMYNTGGTGGMNDQATSTFEGMATGNSGVA